MAIILFIVLNKDMVSGRVRVIDRINVSRSSKAIRKCLCWSIRIIRHRKLPIGRRNDRECGIARRISPVFGFQVPCLYLTLRAFFSVPL